MLTMTLLHLHQRPATSSWWCSPLSNGDGSKWQDRSPRRLTKRSPPLSWTVFLLGCPLTGHNWAAPHLIDRTPFQRLLILALLLISGNVHPNPGLIRINPRPGYPCSICHLDVGRDSLQCSTCLKWVHFHCSSLIHADFRTICATGTAVGWRCPACCPQSQTGSPTQTNSPCYDACVPSSLSPRVPPTTTWLLSTVSPSGPPCYRCSLCSHEKGKDSLKCSIYSKWVHFSCSYLTRAHFRKICATGSTMGWNCLVCLNGNLASSTHQQTSLRPVSSVPLPPLPIQHVHM